MRRFARGLARGCAAGLIGVVIYEVTEAQVAGWMTTAVLLGILLQRPKLAKGRVPWWGALGGGVVFLCWFLEQLVPYPLLIVWPLLGGLLGILAPRKGVGRRITLGVVGIVAGLVGMGIAPLLTQLLLPILGLPTTFDYDVDLIGLPIAGAFIGGTLDIGGKPREERSK